jgi:hypothetical protein
MAELPGKGQERDRKERKGTEVGQGRARERAGNRASGCSGKTGRNTRTGKGKTARDYAGKGGRRKALPARRGVSNRRCDSS